MSVKKCLQCDNVIDIKNKFCNKSCAAIFNNSKFPKRKSTKLSKSTCIKCNVIFALSPKKSGGFYSRKYCNLCLALNRAEVVTGKVGSEILLMNQTKGSLFSRRKNWQSANSAIRKNSRIVYLSSDKPKKCTICEYSLHIEICHIKQVNMFDDSDLISDINNIDNLVALCPNHHWELDNKIIEI